MLWFFLDIFIKVNGEVIYRRLASLIFILIKIILLHFNILIGVKYFLVVGGSLRAFVFPYPLVENKFVLFGI